MGRAVFQPHRDGDLSAGHPLLLRVRHLPAGRRQCGVCVLEEMDWRQLHLALHWSHGKLPTLTKFRFYKTKTLQKFWILFVLAIYLSKYSDIKIGPEDSKPEYNDATW